MCGGRSRRSPDRTEARGIGAARNGAGRRTAVSPSVGEPGRSVEFGRRDRMSRPRMSLPRRRYRRKCPAMFPSYEQIRQEAFFRWQRRGAVHGHHEEDWLAAEQELLLSLNYEVAAFYRLQATSKQFIGVQGR